ncbi:MAG: SAM-dependent methyltransferase, partial [Bacteroidota bacterium]|nr:SAM-dependent methyltransferase [Bacteroidota bacterium]
MKAVDQYSLHPPFVYQLYCSVIKNKKDYSYFKEIEEIRKTIHKDVTLINIQDYGSGSRSSKKTQRKAKDIAKSGLSSPKFSKLLYKLVDHFNPTTVLELGTSLGINSLYLSSHNPQIKVYTFE